VAQTWKEEGAEWASKSMSMVLPTPTPPYMYNPCSLVSCALVGEPVISRVNLQSTWGIAVKSVFEKPGRGSMSCLNAVCQQLHMAASQSLGSHHCMHQHRVRMKGLAWF